MLAGVWGARPVVSTCVNNMMMPLRSVMCNRGGNGGGRGHVGLARVARAAAAVGKGDTANDHHDDQQHAEGHASEQQTGLLQLPPHLSVHVPRGPAEALS